MTITRKINGVKTNITLTQEELYAAHKEVVTDFMADILQNDFCLSKKEAAECAVDAYDIYSEGNGQTEYECIEEAYEKYSESLRLEKLEKNVKPRLEKHVIGITCLSNEEAEDLPEKLLKYNRCWWLRSPGYNQYDVATVYSDGSVFYGGDDVDIGNVAVRPALQIPNLKSLGFKSGDEVEVFDKQWTVISDNLLFCNTDIGKSVFRKDWRAPDANVWEASDLKKYCENWLAEQLEKNVKPRLEKHVIGITCLSNEEAEDLPEKLLKYNRCWWLRSPGDYQTHAAGVYGDDSVDYGGDLVNYCIGAVRPALQIPNLKSLGFKSGDEVEVFDKQWTVISDNLLFCNTDIGKSVFRKDWRAPDANVWEASDLKKYCENWLAEQLAET